MFACHMPCLWGNSIFRFFSNFRVKKSTRGKTKSPCQAAPRTLEYRYSLSPPLKNNLNGLAQIPPPVSARIGGPVPVTPCIATPMLTFSDDSEFRGLIKPKRWRDAPNVDVQWNLSLYIHRWRYKNVLVSNYRTQKYR